jgi:hypothetical protein
MNEYEEATRQWENLPLSNLINLQKTIQHNKENARNTLDALLVQEDVINHLICNKEIKEENTYEPFSFQDQLIGRIIKSKKSNIRALIVGQNIEGVFLTDSYSYKELLERFIFEKDGTPCGKKKE